MTGFTLNIGLQVDQTPRPYLLDPGHVNYRVKRFARECGFTIIAMSLAESDTEPTLAVSLAARADTRPDGQPRDFIRAAVGPLAHELHQGAFARAFIRAAVGLLAHELHQGAIALRWDTPAEKFGQPLCAGELIGHRAEAWGGYDASRFLDVSFEHAIEAAA